MYDAYFRCKVTKKNQYLQVFEQIICIYGNFFVSLQRNFAIRRSVHGCHLTLRPSERIGIVRSQTINRTAEKRQSNMKYSVIIEETLRKEVAIEAQDADEAARIVKALYCKGEIVLNADDFIGEPTIICQ